ncbi:MAG: hypothetical protein DMD99_26150, partial [Candidatus Rokuibacteriota bacterium]
AEFYIWAGVFAPKGTPEPVLAKLRDTLRAAVGDADFKGRWRRSRLRSCSSRARSSPSSSRPMRPGWPRASARSAGSRRK